MDVGMFFDLDTVKLKIDDKAVTHFLYTNRQVNALRRGGVHRLYLGNLRAGMHEMTATFIGKGPQGRDYRRGATIAFEKQSGPKTFELKIKDNTATNQPGFFIEQWQQE